MALKFLILFSVQVFSVAAFAATPQSVCSKIRSMNNVPLTKQNARTCDTVVSRGEFVPAAVDVCLEIAGSGTDSYTQDDTLSCIRKIRNLTFNEVPKQCLRIAEENPFTQTRWRAVNCLVTSSVEGKAEIPVAPVVASPAPLVRQSALVVGRICAQGQDCWSDALKELRGKHNCDVRFTSRVLPKGSSNAGDTVFSFISPNCEIRSAVASEGDECPGGTAARGVGNSLKICVVTGQSPTSAAAGAITR